MSAIRLLISGGLVASGLTLGTLTLNGTFDPPTAGPVLKPWATTTSPSKAATDTRDAKRRKRAEKRSPEQTQKAEQASKPKQPPQQAAAEWPWSWFGN